MELPGAEEAFRYRDPRDMIEDSGWGCVWRNVQTVIASRGLQPPSVSFMMRWLGVGHSPDSPRSMWIEPQDAAKLLAPFVQLTPRLVSFLDPPTQSEDCAQLYERVDDGRQVLMRIVATLSLGVPVLIDDGIVSYCIFGHELMGGENWWIIADPHVENTRRKMAHRIFLDRPWMMLLWDNFQD